MIAIFTWSEILLKIGDRIFKTYPASCNVRTELNGQRKKDQVVNTYPVKGKPTPYYPRQFPSGLFNIMSVEETDDPAYAPIKIKTDATREVFTWELDSNGLYSRPTRLTQIDSCYWIHYTESSTTLGCIKIEKKEDILEFAEILRQYFIRNDFVRLEVL